MKEYVVNIVFDKKGEQILMVHKNRPDFMAGLFNFIGGKLEEYDTSPQQAAIRETLEEANVATNPTSFGTISSGNFLVHVFRDFTDNIFEYQTMEDEPIHLLNTEKALSLSREQRTPINVSTLIEGALRLPQGHMINIVEP